MALEEAREAVREAVRIGAMVRDREMTDDAATAMLTDAFPALPGPLVLKLRAYGYRTSM